MTLLAARWALSARAWAPAAPSTLKCDVLRDHCAGGDARLDGCVLVAEVTDDEFDFAGWDDGQRVGPVAAGVGLEGGAGNGDLGADEKRRGVGIRDVAGEGAVQLRSGMRGDGESEPRDA